MDRFSLLSLLPLCFAVAPAALAQSESYLLGPGSDVGKQTTVDTYNCVTAADGSITCDTRLQNPAGSTQARPQFNPFSN
jgi:hypothetical protein